MNEDLIRDSLQRLESKVDQANAALGALSNSYARQDERLIRLTRDHAQLEKRVDVLEDKTDERFDGVEKSVLVLTWRQKFIIAGLGLGAGAVGNVATDLISRLLGGS